MIKKAAFGLVLLCLLTFTYFNGMLHFQYVAINMDAALTSLWLLRSVTLAVFLYLGLVCRWYKPWTVAALTVFTCIFQVFAEDFYVAITYL